MFDSLSECMELARSTYVAGDFQRSKCLLDAIIDEAGDTAYCVGARYLRARGYEDGAFSIGPDLQKAYSDFMVVKEHAKEYGSDGLLGCARVLFEMDCSKHKNEIMYLCSEAIAQDSNVKAMMLLGRTYEIVLGDGPRARACYLRAFFRGMPWGMRFFARSQSSDGHYVRAMASHLLATITAPILVLFKGVRSPLK
jgi:hypothetical protein